MPSQATGFIALIPIDLWGTLSTPVAIEVWGKTSPHWGLSVPHVPSLKGGSQNSEPHRFMVNDHTKQCMAKIQAADQSRKILILPVRSETIGEMINPLGPDEFDLGLTDALWVMCTHWEKLVQDRHEFKIACLGERYDGHEVPVIGFRKGNRSIDVMGENSSFAGCHRIIGCMPVKTE